MPDIQEELSALEQEGTLRKLPIIEGGLDFSSNDYLGFSRNQNIKRKLIDYLETNQSIGATGSRLISGNYEYIRLTEDYIAKIFSSEATLFFGSGFLANMGIVKAFASKNTEFFSDQLNHASLVDGMRGQGLKITIFRHNDMTHLEKHLELSTAKRKVIVTESIFSMDGDSAPISDLRNLSERFGAYTILDEAHATGTSGKNGLGLSHDSHWPRLVSMHTASKALGAYGSFVCCSLEIKKFLVNRARSFIYSTALPPHLIAQIKFALDELLNQKEHLSSLKSNIKKMNDLLKEEGIVGVSNYSHIIPFVVSSNEGALRLSDEFKRAGVSVLAIRHPTVPKGTERLRFTIKSFHTTADLELVCRLLANCK